MADTELEGALSMQTGGNLKPIAITDLCNR